MSYSVWVAYLDFGSNSRHRNLIALSSFFHTPLCVSKEHCPLIEAFSLQRHASLWIIVVLENLWFFFSLKAPLDEVRNALTDTLSTHIHYFEEFAASPVSQPYFSGFLTIAVAFRFYFALKATRVFGPFTKLIKINAVSPLPWMLVTGLILLFSSSCLYVLLS